MHWALPLLFLSGCYLSHQVGADPRSDGGATDGGATDTGPAVGLCAPTERFVRVELRGDCEYGEFSFFAPDANVLSGRLVLELTALGDDGSFGACRVTVAGLSDAVADAFVLRFERIFDGWMEVSPSGLAIRDTSLCDGPPPSECRLTLEARSSELIRDEAFGAVSVRWGETRCSCSGTGCGGEHGELRALEFAFSLGERIDRAVLQQGEINTESRAGTRFANLRSWSSYTDGPLETVTWAFWTP